MQLRYKALYWYRYNMTQTRFYLYGNLDGEQLNATRRPISDYLLVCTLTNTSKHQCFFS